MNMKIARKFESVKSTNGNFEEYIYGLFHIRFTIKILINLKILFLVLERKKNDTYFFFQYDM